MKRRTFLASSLLLASSARGAASVAYPLVVPGHALEFPRDHGAHSAFRTEWWYITGWLDDGRGLQITFFRNRPGVAEDIANAFAPKQLVFAHAALADRSHGRLRHDQRVAREGFGLAQAREGTTDVWIDDWSLRANGAGYVAKLRARDFAFDLVFASTQPLMLQGERGYSRKGPLAGQASYYYSRPHLAVSGTVSVDDRSAPVAGTAWLDHEWSSEYLSPDAAGWDWVGLNLDDGGALMAFRIRAKDGSVFWAGGAMRDARGTMQVFAPHEVRFEPLASWRSPRTEVEYPVAMRVTAGGFAVELEPLMQDQELDSRGSTGTIYWEGAVRAKQGARAVGVGYLELTGYWKRVAM